MLSIDIFKRHKWIKINKGKYVPLAERYCQISFLRTFWWFLRPNSPHINVFFFFLFSSYQPSRRSVWENLDRGRKYRPNAVRSVHRPRLISSLLCGKNKKKKNNSIYSNRHIACEQRWAEVHSFKFCSSSLFFFFPSAFCHLQKSILFDENSQWLCILVCNFFTSKHYRSGCRSIWENLDRGQYPFQPIKFMNLVVPSPCEMEPYNN